MALDWSTLALEAVNFLILVWLLQRFLYRPVLAAIDRRRGRPNASLPKPRPPATRRRRCGPSWARNARPGRRADSAAREGPGRRGSRAPAAHRGGTQWRQRSGRRAMPAWSTSAPRAWPLRKHAARLAVELAERLLRAAGDPRCDRRPCSRRLAPRRSSKCRPRSTAPCSFGREPSRADHHRRALG